MGLDMFAWRVKGGADLPDVDAEMPEQREELYYWRKHPNLHGWMEALYRVKGGADPDFNGNVVRITLEDLDRLEASLDNLPHTEGFFFGTSGAEDRDDDVEFIAKAREAIAAGDSVFYDSSW